MFGFNKKERNKQTGQPFPKKWQEAIDKNIPYYRRLPADKQKDLRGLVQRFIDEKTFEGCKGFQITDEVRVMVAAQACLLVLGGGEVMYPDLRSILIYPHDYYANVKQTAGDGVVTEGLQKRAGESWSHGNVVLAWDDVQRGAADTQDGKNLVFHEFAHQLDRSYGATAGIESGSGRNAEADAWARVLRESYQRFIKELEAGRATLLDAYGATNLAEFFAVTTECFFEQPRELRPDHPELYEQFSAFYRQDPVDYFN